MFSQIILLTGMPRSGTSWLSQIFDSNPHVRFRLSPLFSYEYKNRLNESSSFQDWEAVLQGAYRSSNEFMDQTVRRNLGQYPVFPVKDDNPPCLAIKDTRFHNLTERALELLPALRVVAIVRHPCGAIHSWLTSRGEFPATADPLREWRTGQCRKTGYGEFWGFDDWRAVTTMHLDLAERFHDRVYIQRYEELVNDPAREGARLMEFAGLEFHPQTRDFISKSHSLHNPNEYAVFKNRSVAVRWQTELSPVIQETILSELRDTRLERFLS
jgi:hypothetical protein